MERIASAGMGARNTWRGAEAVGSPALVSFLFILINRQKMMLVVRSTKKPELSCSWVPECVLCARAPSLAAGVQHPVEA
jgi:hypothetical protein